MNITERQAEILNRIVEDYIDLTQPISSEFLEKKHDFGICPATIRIEMQKLTDKGYLYQPHTSAGRIPTDRGYRFFVDNLLEKGISEFEEFFKIEEILAAEREDILRWASDLTKFLAETYSSFAILHLISRDFLFKEGWGKLLREPEFKDRGVISDFLNFLENFEKNIEDLKINSKIRIFIGRENPFKKAKNFSIISSKCCLPDEEEGIISLLGPKRMNYDKNISLINSLRRLLEDL